MIPLHFEGWAHVTQAADELKAAFSGNGIADRLYPAHQLLARSGAIPTGCGSPGGTSGRAWDDAVGVA